MPKVKLLDTEFTDGIKNYIKCRVVICGLTQTELAKRTGMTASTMSLRMNHPGTFRIDEIVKIAIVLKTEPIKIITGIIQ